MYKNLPKKVLERIQELEFASDLIDDAKGIVYLKNGWEFEDGSQQDVFLNKKDLIERVMESEKSPYIIIQGEEIVFKTFDLNEAKEKFDQIKYNAKITQLNINWTTLEEFKYAF